MRKIIILLLAISLHINTYAAAISVPRPSSWSTAGKYQAGKFDLAISNGLTAADMIQLTVAGAKFAWKHGARILPATTTAAAAWVARNPIAVAGIIATGVGGAGLLAWLNDTGVKMSADGTKYQTGDATACTVVPCYEFRSPSTPYFWDRDSEKMARLHLQYISNATTTYVYHSSTPNDYRFYYTRIINGVPNNTVVSATLTYRTIPPVENPVVDITPEQTEVKLAAKPITAEGWKSIPVALPAEVVHNPTSDLSASQPITQNVGSRQISVNPPRWEHRQVTLTPSAADPWQFDISETVTESDSADPAIPNPENPPSPVDPDLCMKYPNILACASGVNFGTLEPVEVKQETRGTSINPDAGWNQSAQCPQPRQFRVAGLNFEMPFTAICDFAISIRPLIIGFAWVTAAMTFLGFARRD